MHAHFKSNKFSHHGREVKDHVWTYSFVSSTELLKDTFDLQHMELFQNHRYNIAPGQFIMAIIQSDDHRTLTFWKWGLIPFWAKENHASYSSFNAKSETVFDKPMFRVPVRKQRCLIPADGFYEWKRTGKTKQPMRIVVTDRPVFAFAGIYDVWRDKEGNTLHTVSILTTSPNALMQDIHDRMPVILPPESEATWLNPTIQDRAVLEPLLIPYPADQMRAFPVASMVNNAKNDVLACVEPSSIEQPSFFD